MAELDIVVLGSNEIDSEKQWTYITIELKGAPRRYTAVTPILTGVDLQNHLVSQRKEYALDLLSDRYPTIPRFTTLLDFQEWWDAGRIDPATGKEAVAVDSEHEHPEYLKAIPIIDAITDLNGVKDFLKKLVRRMG